MANASKDNNGIPTMIAALNSDGVTPINIVVDASNHALMVDDNTTGSDNGTVDAKRDANRQPVMMGVSSDDGVTPVVIYADADGSLLIDSN